MHLIAAKLLKGSGSETISTKSANLLSNDFNYYERVFESLTLACYFTLYNSRPVNKLFIRTTVLHYEIYYLLTIRGYKSHASVYVIEHRAQ
jgi:hypothetical protein